MNGNTLTNIAGALGAAAMSAQPILNGVSGSLHQQDYFSLFGAVSLAIIGFFTHKAPSA